MDVRYYGVYRNIENLIGAHVSMGRWFRGQLGRDYMSDQIMDKISPHSAKVAIKAKDNEKICPGNTQPSIDVGYWKQPFDHFDSKNKQTWKQVRNV